MLFLNKSPFARKPRNDEESYFVDEHGKTIKFPSLADNPTVDLSVIVPAYNEQYRREFNFIKYLTKFILSAMCILFI